MGREMECCAQTMETAEAELAKLEEEGEAAKAQPELEEMRRWAEESTATWKERQQGGRRKPGGADREDSERDGERERGHGWGE